MNFTQEGMRAPRRYVFVSKDGLDGSAVTHGETYIVRRCADGSERTYAMTARMANGVRELFYEEACERPAVTFLDDPSALKKERDELKARNRSLGCVMADACGERDSVKRQLDESQLRVAWLERELKLEKAKNARKRGL